WIERDERYGEKLATPDVSIADIVGEIDPIKVAEGRYLADEETIHYGLVPRTNRGIFAINELPDLMEKVQVGLFNLMEEKDVQIKGYKIRLPLDVVIVASANPEDYTSRGRIITPLKDRFDVQIRTHYPKSIDDEIVIMEQEAAPINQRSRKVEVPRFLKEILGHLTFEARKSNEINQSSGVSVRVTINNFESLISNAEKRSLRCKENEIVPRVSDLHAILASTSGKIEMEYVGEDKKEDELVEKLLNRSIVKVFDQYFSLNSLQKIVEYFNSGWGVEVSDQMASQDYLQDIKEIPGLKEAIRSLGIQDSPSLMASATEFLLEGLHLHQKLNKEIEGGRGTYGNKKQPALTIEFQFLTPYPMVHIRYSRWDRSTRNSLDSDTVFDQLNEYMNDSGDLQQAMRRLMQKGIKRGENQTKGIDDLLSQVAREMRKLYDEYRLQSAMDEVQEQLESIVDQERQTLEELDQAGQDVQEKKQFLNNLPGKASEAVEKLTSYRFENTNAEKEFQQLLMQLEQIRKLENWLRREGSLFRGQT